MLKIAVEILEICESTLCLQTGYLVVLGLERIPVLYLSVVQSDGISVIRYVLEQLHQKLGKTLSHRFPCFAHWNPMQVPVKTISPSLPDVKNTQQQKNSGKVACQGSAFMYVIVSISNFDIKSFAKLICPH